VRSAQRIERGELQARTQQQQRGRHWRTRPDPLAEVWDSVLVPMLFHFRLPYSGWCHVEVCG
jgi:hypothetical protein